MSMTAATPTMTAVSKNFTKVQGNLLIWKISTSKLTTAEAEQRATEIRNHVNSGKVSKMIVDNKDLDGVFTPEVNQVWEQLMKFIAMSGKMEKIACISPSIVAKMQVDRLSRQAGSFNFNRAFLSEEEAMAFLGLA